MSPTFLSKNKYIFDKETLCYYEVEINWKNRFRNIFLIILSCFLLAIIFVYSFLGYITTPKEVLLSTENKILFDKYQLIQKEINSYTKRLDSLNKVDDSLYRAVFGEKPIAHEIRLAGIGGSYGIQKYDSSNYEELIKCTSQKLKALNNQFKVSENSYKELLSLARKQKEKLKNIPAIMPVHNKNLERTGSGFGKRYHPILNIWRMHEGLDFNAPEGTKIYATGNATVKRVYVSKTFGNCIILDHGYGYETFYAHLQKFNIKQGQKVKRGEVIGFMGTTGLSSGVHLHYEVHLNGVEVDPVNYFYNDLTPEQYNQIISIANSFITSMD